MPQKTLTLKELLETMKENYYNAYREMFKNLRMIGNLIELRYIHDVENHKVFIYDGYIKTVGVLDTPLLDILYSFNETKISINGIPGAHTIIILPKYECLYQLIILSNSHRNNIEAITRFYEL